MLKWYHSLYIGDGVQRYERRIRKRLDAGKTVIGHYLITLASNRCDQLDIVMTRDLCQDVLRERTPMIVGIAANRKEALGLVVRMTEDALDARGDADLRAYFGDTSWSESQSPSKM